MYVTTSISGHSVVIEGSKDKLNSLKKKLKDLLKSNEEINDQVFIELQSVFKEMKAYTPIKSTDIEKGLTKPTQEISIKGKNFFKAFASKEESKEEPTEEPTDNLVLPPVPTGHLSLEELVNKFGFEKKGRYFYIKVPEDLKETLRIVKLMHEPNPKEKRFSIIFDKEDPNSPTYNFEIEDPSNSVVVIRRPISDDDDFKFYLRSLRLLNFYEQIDSGPILNKFLKRAVNYLKYSTSKYSNDDNFDPTKVPEFHCELLDKEYVVPPIESFTKYPVQIPIFNAIFLIEIFCSHQEKEHKCNFSKPFLDRKTIYLLSIIAPFPVAFQLNPNSTVTLTFADSEIGSAQFVFNQVKFAMDIFNNLPRIDICFQNVDSDYFNAGKLITISQKINFAVVRGLDTNSNGISGTFQIWGVPNQKGDDQVKELRKECENIFNEIQLFPCDQCRRQYSIGFGGECTLSEHPGDMIKFDDGQMEHSMVTEDMEEVVTVNYSCCGEVPKFSAGCQEMVFPHGHRKTVDANGNDVTYSNLTIQVI